jgi:ketosteroid isomerase-like protein
MRAAPVVLVLGAALVLSGCAHAASAPPSADRSSLEQRRIDFAAALADRNAEAIAALFADTARLHVANMPPVEGRATIQQFYAKMFQFMASSSPAPEVTDISASHDLAYEAGRVSNAFRGAAGTIEYAGKYLIVWKWVEGNWMIVLYAVSSDQPDSARSRQ